MYYYVPRGLHKLEYQLVIETNETDNQELYELSELCDKML